MSIHQTAPGGQSLEQQIQQEFMKQDYDASRATLSAKPFQTHYARTQDFLIYPAEGRSVQQLRNDYQKLSTTATNTRIKELLKSAYTIGWARHEPDQAIAWARQHILNFDSEPKQRNQFFKLWNQHDPTTAGRWLRNHPDSTITLETPIKNKVITIAVLPNKKKATLTLPR